MTSRIQAQRFSLTNNKPTAGVRTPGEIYLNFPDLRLGMIDASRNPVDILAMRRHAPTASYTTGDHVVANSLIYVAKTDLAPKAFAATDWNSYLPVVNNTIPAITSSGNITGQTLISNNGRIISSMTGAGNSPSFSMWNITNAKAAGFWSNNGEINFGAMDGAGVPAVYYGGVDANKNLYMTGAITTGNYLASANGIYYANFNGSEWHSYIETNSNDKITSYRSGWYDRWQNSTGARYWAGPSGYLLTLDGSGTLVASGVVRGSQLWASVFDNSNGIYTSGGGRWRNWQVSTDGWRWQWDNTNGWMQYINSGGTALFTIDGGGSITALGNINTGNDIGCRSLYASTNVQGAWLHSTGSAQIDGSIGVSGNVNCANSVTGGYVRSTGTVQADGNFNGNQGIIVAGNMVGNAIFCANGLFAGGNGDTSLGVYRGGSGRVMQMAGGWYWDWNGGNGTMIWMRDGAGPFWVMYSPSSLCYNNSGPIGGTNFFQTSDQRFKQDVQPLQRGLSEILRLQPVSYRRLRAVNTQVEGRAIPGPEPQTEVGFVAQAVRAILPEAVVEMPIETPDGDPNSLALAYSTITATLVRAVQELTARVIALEAPA
jgi:hypothetical protein